MGNQTENLRGEIAAFLERTGMAPGTFGLLAAKNGRLIERLDAGGTVTLPTLERINRFIREYGGPEHSRGRDQS